MHAANNHSTKPFTKADKRAAIELWWASEGHQEPTENVCTNMEDWKREIVKLWVTRMSDNSYLQNLVESMPRRLQEVIERDRATTEY